MTCDTCGLPSPDFECENCLDADIRTDRLHQRICGWIGVFTLSFIAAQVLRYALGG